MRNYDLYIIDETFAYYYYGKERMFFNLFQELDESPSVIKDILLKQVEYITRPIPSLRIHTILMQHLQKYNHFFVDKGNYYLENQNGSAELQILERKIIIYASGNIDSEMIFMEVLGKADPHFLAVDITNVKYGWVKPLKEKILLQRPKFNQM